MVSYYLVDSEFLFDLIEKKVLEMDRGGGCGTLEMYLTSLNWILKNGEKDTLYVTIF